MRRTRVKICGITRQGDALEAARLGADAIGLVFYRGSPRAVDAEQAAGICRVLPPFVTSVGLFVDPAAEDVHAVLDAVPLDLLQFHGDETATFCRGFGRPYIKAIRMREALDLAASAREYADARGILLDSFNAAAHGGTGESFDWSRIPGDLDCPVVLAGGLGPDNVEQAIVRVRPYAVDVSSGVERDKGIKDAGKMAAFMRGVNRGDSI